MNDFKLFFQFFKNYLLSRALLFGRKFENLKDIVVAILVVKRGKYSSSFLNTTFLLLIITVLIAGPTIAENNPFDNTLEENQAYFESSSVAFDPYQSSVSTVVSRKPRDKVEKYAVKSGDTLASIGSKFNVSVDTIKWANNMKNETIRPGDTLDIPPVTGVVHKVVAGDNIIGVTFNGCTSN